MKYTIAAALVAAFSLGACSTAPTTPTQPVAALTPQQIGTQICPALEVTIPAIQAIVGLPQGAYDDLEKAQVVVSGKVATATQPAVPGLCTVINTLTASDAQQLEQIAFQTVLPIVEASNPKLAAELEVAQIVVGFANAVQAGAQAGAVTPAK